MKKKHEEEEVSRDSFGIWIKALGVEESF